MYSLRIFIIDTYITASGERNGGYWRATQERSPIRSSSSLGGRCDSLRRRKDWQARPGSGIAILGRAYAGKRARHLALLLARSIRSGFSTLGEVAPTRNAIDMTALPSSRVAARDPENAVPGFEESAIPGLNRGL